MQYLIQPFKHIAFETNEEGKLVRVRFLRHADGRYGQMPEVVFDVDMAWLMPGGTPLLITFNVSGEVPLDTSGNLALHRYENVAGPGDAAYGYAVVPGYGVMALLPSRRVPWLGKMDDLQLQRPDGYETIQVDEQSGLGPPRHPLVMKLV